MTDTEETVPEKEVDDKETEKEQEETEGVFGDTDAGPDSPEYTEE
jgi:hypothetical protein